MLSSTEMALSVPRGQVSTHELLAFLTGFLEMNELDRLSLRLCPELGETLLTA